jgi:hypothetical protein
MKSGPAFSITVMMVIDASQAVRPVYAFQFVLHATVSTVQSSPSCLLVSFCICSLCDGDGRKLAYGALREWMALNNELERRQRMRSWPNLSCPSIFNRESQNVRISRGQTTRGGPPAEGLGMGQKL